MKKLLRTFFSLSMIYCLLLPFTASTKETGTSMKTAANATTHEIAKIDAKELLVLLQASNEEKVILKAENTSLQQKVQDLTNTNSTSDKHLQDLIIQLNNRIDRLENRSTDYTTAVQLELLATSFYERLRSTDDSVSFWGIISGWVATLITLILATFAVFHFGKIRDIENKAKNILEQSQRETRMAVNEAIRNAKKAATEITHKWVQEEGAKEIKIFVQDLNTQLDEVQIAISKVRNSEKIVDEAAQSIQNHEKALAQSLPSNKEDENNSAVNVDFLPNELNKHRYNLVQKSCGSEPTQKSIQLINDILSKSKDENKDILAFKVFCFTISRQYKRAISFYEKHLFSYYEEKDIDYLNKVPVLSSIMACHYYSKNYVTIYQETTKALSALITHGSYVFRAHQIVHLNLLAQLELQTLTADSLKIYEEVLALEGNDFSEDDKDVIQKAIFIAELHLKPDSKSSEDILNFVCNAHTLTNVIKRTITVSHELGKRGKSKESLELTSHIRQVLLKRQKRAHFNNYLIITLNHANSLYKCGHLRPARRLAKFIDKKVNQDKVMSLDEAGYKEINEILDRKQ
ncbi:hypothetical protein [Vibrio sp. 99-70-13A1]|uniref:hypothetical protein n=1 Tax=Vibrio sp. 99-70-13A1 TaxID=2607601 RepID=UPI001493D868|nr:hypothetical protein [Vibrio sp. 99-70-13A1]NOH95330.1 hypothetical protein [Vibrio sp. 99-70-13A1]